MGEDHSVTTTGEEDFTIIIGKLFWTYPVLRLRKDFVPVLFPSDDIIDLTMRDWTCCSHGPFININLPYNPLLLAQASFHR